MSKTVIFVLCDEVHSIGIKCSGIYYEICSSVVFISIDSFVAVHLCTSSSVAVQNHERIVGKWVMSYISGTMQSLRLLLVFEFDVRATPIVYRGSKLVFSKEVGDQES
jgi:hypothetical protein